MTDWLLFSLVLMLWRSALGSGLDEGYKIFLCVNAEEITDVLCQTGGTLPFIQLNGAKVCKVSQTYACRTVWVFEITIGCDVFSKQLRPTLWSKHKQVERSVW